MARLAGWLAPRAKTFELAAQRRDADGPLVDRALDAVRAFIAEKGLVVFGGLAVDFALRAAGAAGIYPEGQRPDFDVLSPRSVDDAYELAGRLHAAGFPGVGAIRGIHVQTMRVRTDFVFVADVGFAPPGVFEALPTFEFEGLRVLHPDFQRMDMHLAFCFPFGGPPREDVAHRWKKDAERFRRLTEAYPVPLPPGGPGALATAACALRRPAAFPAGALPPPGEALCALHGFAAFAVLGAALDRAGAALAGLPPGRLAPGAPRLALAFPGGDGLRVAVEGPAAAGALPAFASPAPDAFLAGAPAVRRAPFMDVAPEAFAAEGFEVVSVRGRRLAAVAADLGGGLAGYVVCPAFLLLWLLCQAHRAGPGAARDAFRAFYAHALALLAAADALFAGALRGAADAGARRAVLDAFAASPFAPAVSTIGRENFDAAYLIVAAGAAERARDSAEAARAALGVDVAGLLSGLPANFYPASAARPPAFDYSASPLFRRDGGDVLPD